MFPRILVKTLPIILIGFLLVILFPNYVYSQSESFETGTISLSDEFLVTDFEAPSSLVTGGEIKAHKIYTDFKILILELRTWDDGELTVKLPRTLIDAKLGNSDDAFFVLVDGTENEFDETKNPTYRTVTVSFPEGTQEIWIIGTQVIPEFNEIAIMVLGSSVLLIVIISKKFKILNS